MRRSVKWLAAGLLMVLAVCLAAGALVVFRAYPIACLYAPAPTLLLTDRHGEFLAEVGETDNSEVGYWQVDPLPPRVVSATLAIEDTRFYEHPGVDWRAILRATLQNVRTGRRISGASTIAMQVARMQRSGPRTYSRKAVEAAAAWLMTRRYGRDAVLAHYLRIAPYGNRIHGIGYAARRYLDKPVEDLSWAEIAFLTAIPQAPARMNPFLGQGRRQAEKRGMRILGRLRDQRILSPQEYDLAMRQIVRLQVPAPGVRPNYAMHAVLRLASEIERAGSRPEGGMVRANLDLDIQEEASWLTFQALQGWRREGAGNAALIVVDRPTNEVLAWVGSKDYFDAEAAGAIDYTRTPRSPGSLLKPFFYAFALERGVIGPAAILDDLDRGAGGIVNADGRFLGPLLPRTALGNSRNVPAAELLDRLGLEEGYGFLGDLGLHDHRVSARRYGLGLAIGALPVSLEQVIRAYTLFTQEGRLADLVWYDGQPTERPRRLISEETAREITLFLADPSARLPSFERMGSLEYPFPVAVKTGTSSRFRDAWAIAYSTRYLVGVWVGEPDFHSMNGLTGYNSAAELVQSMLRYLHQDQEDGLEDVAFPSPLGYERRRLCALTGALAGQACPQVVEEWLPAAELPAEECRAHIALAVDARTGALASPATPAETTEVRTFVMLPPRYAAWAASAGLPIVPASYLRPQAAPPLGPAPEERRTRISITTPAQGLRILRDPETPPDQATMALKAVVDPPSRQLVWYVDGIPFKVADYPYTARWPLSPGAHNFEARLPNSPGRSGVVEVVVE